MVTVQRKNWLISLFTDRISQLRTYHVIIKRRGVYHSKANGKGFFYATRTEIILIGLTGLSLRVGTLEICLTSSTFSVTFPKTGWAEGVDLSNQSRKLLCATFKKNWEPPDSGRPVFAMLKVPTSFEIFWWGFPTSSGMPPSRVRVIVCPSQLWNVLPGLGPPVPERCELASLECGQPNWFMKLGIYTVSSREY